MADHRKLSGCAQRGESILWRAVRVRLTGPEHAIISSGAGGSASKIACAEDGSGRLWLGIDGGKLMMRDGRGWHSTSGALAKLRPWDLTTTPSGDLALIVPPDIAFLHGNRMKTVRLTPTGIGTPWAVMPSLLPGSRDIFISGSAGLARIRGAQLRHLNERHFPWMTWIRTLQQTSRGETWLFSRTGVYRVATAALDRAFDNPRAPLPFTKFDALDGLASSVQQGGFAGPQSAVAGDGRIWFLNRQGAAFLNPATLHPNRLAPPVMIRSLVSGGRVWRDPADVVLPAGTRSLDLTYAGLSFTVPQRVRFRYRLDGADEAWVEAGSRRTTSYSNLGPGHYRFRVVAANNDGVWSPAGAALDLEIPPTFIQGWLFKILCAAAVLALLWLGYSMRLRAVAGAIRLRTAERVEERERIARELHDTLLQSVQSLTLRFQLTADDLPLDAAARTSLIAAIDTADQVIAEGRDRVRELRTKQDGDFEQIICDLIARLDFDALVDISVTTAGLPRRLDPLVLDEIVRIVGEALANARRHADASRLAVAIQHGPSFQLRVADDGEGIDPAIVARRGTAGHFGLMGMFERAQKLRADLDIRALTSGGTELLLTVPGPIAYYSGERSPFERLWSWLWSKDRRPRR